MRQLSLPHAPQQSTVDGGDIGRVGFAALMLIDTRPTDGSIDDADRDLLALDQSSAEFQAPVADLAFARIAAASDGVAPEFLSRVVGIASCAAEVDVGQAVPDRSGYVCYVYS